MSYGLAVNGESGFVQITNNNSTYIIKASGVLASSVSHASLQGLFNPSAREMLFIAPSANSGKIGFSNASTIRCTTGDIKYVVLIPSMSIGPSSDTYGLRSWSDSGVLLFDSGYKIPKPLTSVTMAVESSASISLPAPLTGRSRYVELSFLTLLSRLTWNNGNGQNYYSYINWSSQSSITFGRELVYDGLSGPSTQSPRTGHLYASIMEL